MGFHMHGHGSRTGGSPAFPPPPHHTTSMSNSHESPSGTDLTLDRTFRLLSDPVRRRVLDTLAADSPRSMEEVVAHTPDDLQGERARIALQHYHFPKLEEAAVIENPDDEPVVARGEDFAAMEPVIDLLDEHDERLPGDWP